jgi:hypothetical protein
MIPISDVYIYECTLQNTNNKNMSNSFIPSVLIAWSYYIINDKTIITESDSNYLNIINEVKERLSKIVKHIEVLVASIVQINHANHTNYNPESDNSSIPAAVDDTFVRKYINAIRLIQDYYQIMSITIQVLIVIFFS